MGSEELPEKVESELDFVEPLYNEHRDELSGKLTVQDIPSFKVIYQAGFQPLKEHGRPKLVLIEMIENHLEYHLGVEEENSTGRKGRYRHPEIKQSNVLGLASKLDQFIYHYF